MTAPRLAVKVRRSVWVEVDHPRDRLGKFIETGAEVRVWGGIGGKVLRNVGGGRLEIERSDGQHVIVHRNYLTVVARPDGSAPTDSRDANPAALQETAASPDAVEIATPDQAPAVPDGAGDHGPSLAGLLRAQDTPAANAAADHVETAARDYLAALDNSTPNDEADERAGLVEALDNIEARFGHDEKIAAAVTTLRGTAEAEPPAPKKELSAAEQVDAAFVRAQIAAREAGDAMTAGVVDMARRAHDDGDEQQAGVMMSLLGNATLPEVVALRETYSGGAPDKPAPVAGSPEKPFVPGAEVRWTNPDPESFQSGWDATFSHYADDPSEALIDRPTTKYELARNRRLAATQRMRVRVVDLAPRAKRVYDGRDQNQDQGGGPNGPHGDTGGTPLPGTPAGGVREDQGQAPVLSDLGGPGAGADRLPAGRPDPTGAAGGDVPAGSGAPLDGPSTGGVAGVPGGSDAGAATGAGSGRPDAGPGTDGGDAGVPGRTGEPSSAAGVDDAAARMARIDAARADRAQQAEAARQAPRAWMAVKPGDVLQIPGEDQPLTVHENISDEHAGAITYMRDGEEQTYIPVRGEEPVHAADAPAYTSDSAILADEARLAAAHDAQEQDRIDAEHAAARERQRIRDNFDLYGSPEIPTDAQLAAEVETPTDAAHVVDLAELRDRIAPEPEPPAEPEWITEWGHLQFAPASIRTTDGQVITGRFITSSGSGSWQNRVYHYADAQGNGGFEVAANVEAIAIDPAWLAEEATWSEDWSGLDRVPGTVRDSHGATAHGHMTSLKGGGLALVMDDGTIIKYNSYEVGKVKPDPAAFSADDLHVLTDDVNDVADTQVPDVAGESIQPTVDRLTVSQLDRIGGESFVPPTDDNMTPAGKMAKLDANLAALRTLRTLQREARDATPLEQETLSRWAGWGGLPEIFDLSRPEYDNPGPNGALSRRAELLTLLSTAEWNEARVNTLNAHYTDPRVVSAVWDAMRDLGFNGGRVLEPGSGSGTFIGLAPENTDMIGVELDSTTAALSKYLYPDATIRNESFADTKIPDGAFDATVGNVPFGRFSLFDLTHNPDGESIHNHFILKSLALTRPGGLVGVLSSRYTLDSKRDAARRKMYEQADLIGAVRLPTGSHSRASGTDVIEDILIFRKRPEGAEPGDDSWVTSTEQDINGFNLPVSDYFTAHPDHVLGEVTAEKGQYGTGSIIVRGDVNMSGLPDVLGGITIEAKRRGLLGVPRPDDGSPLPEILSSLSDRHEGHIEAADGGGFTQAVGGAVVPFDVPPGQVEELGALVGLRDALMDLLNAEKATEGDSDQITALREALNARYDGYVATYGPINRFSRNKNGARNRPRVMSTFGKDPLSASVRALETYDPSTNTATKASIFANRTVAPRNISTTASTPQDALVLSMDTYGEVNLPGIANMLGVTEPEAREKMRGLIYEVPDLSERDEKAVREWVDARIENPDAPLNVDLSDAASKPGRFVPAAEYLSGHVRNKHAQALAMAAIDPRFQENAAALKEVIPTDLGPAEIDGRLGAAWIDAATVEEFMRSILRVPRMSKDVQVVHSGGSIWTVKGPRYGSASTEEWGTEDKYAYEIIQALLEQRSIKITRTDPVTDRRYADLDATLAAQQKAEAIQERFSEWLWENPDRARVLQARYNHQFNGIALRTYDGSGRTFPGMAETWNPHEHVKNAVDRIVNEPTALLAHVVGAGKTAEMVMGSAELRRLGLARKPAIVVPNHMLEQFTREYLEIYPNAKLLAAGTKDLSGPGRREFVARAATGDWDAVILTQNAFESIPMSGQQQEAYIQRELATMREQLEAAKVNGGDDQGTKRTVKKMETALQNAETALRKRLAKTKDIGVSFEQTGIDYLMVDEAHMYSNLRTLSNIQGGGATGSGKATDLHMKMEYLRETTKSGRVATFATGTPIRNTVTQAYVMQRFLRPDLLREAGVHTFDQWAATFGSTVDEMELKPEGNGFRQTTRFAKFRNVPELLRMFHTFADVKLAEDLKLNRPNVRSGDAQTIAVPRSEAQAAYIRELGDRADDVRAGNVPPEEDNMLKISTDGRKAALSMELVGGVHEPGKIEAAADKINEIYGQTKDQIYTRKDGTPDPVPGSLQIVFLDMGTPKGGKAKDEEASVDDNTSDWNGYDTLKAELVARGIPAEKIRYMHEAKNDAEKAEIFAAARSGQIAVLLGSSEKMGVGTNMQTRAVALHHLDAPWRPADVEQRDGRIVRHGNLNTDVDLFRYVTEGSFDAYMWQTLERKAKFINQIMRGSLDVREIEDIGDTAMSYAEVKALATGNPDLLEKAKIDTVVTKLQRLERTHARTQTNMSTEIERLTVRGQFLTERAQALNTAAERAVDTAGDRFTMTVGDQDFKPVERALPALDVPEGAKVVTDEEAGIIMVQDADGAVLSRTPIPETPEGSPRMRAGTALRDRLLEIRQSDMYRSYNAPEHSLGTLGGFTVMGKVAGDEQGNVGVQVWLDGLPGSEYKFTLADLGKESMSIGMVTRLERAITSVVRRRDQTIEDATDALNEVNAMQARVGRGFEQSAMLNAARRKQERLAEKMERDSRREAGQRIEFDPHIDTDQFDDPILSAGSATPVVTAPPEAPPVAAEVSAHTLAQGDRIEFVAQEVSGTMGTGTITAVRTVGSFVFVTVKGDDGKEYTRAFATDQGIVKIGDRVGGEVKSRLMRVLRVIDGQVVVTIEQKKAAGRFDASVHPRDRNGRFIETGAEVRIWGGGLGKITGVASGGRVNVHRSDGSDVTVDAGNVTVTKKPTGEAVGAPAAPDAPAAPEPGVEAPRTAREAAHAAHPPARTTPAPEATPDNAFALFEAPDGARAWLDNSSGKPVGYTQDDPNDPSSIVRFEDPEEWARDVDAVNMVEQPSPQEFGGSDTGTAHSATQEAHSAAADAAAPPETPEDRAGTAPAAGGGDEQARLLEEERLSNVDPRPTVDPETNEPIVTVGDRRYGPFESPTAAGQAADALRARRKEEGGIDATPPAPDATPPAPDATPAAPDATPPAPDATPAAPDATPSADVHAATRDLIVGRQLDQQTAHLWKDENDKGNSAFVARVAPDGTTAVRVGGTWHRYEEDKNPLGAVAANVTTGGRDNPDRVFIGGKRYKRTDETYTSMADFGVQHGVSEPSAEEIQKNLPDTGSAPVDANTPGAAETDAFIANLDAQLAGPDNGPGGGPDAVERGAAVHPDKPAETTHSKNLTRPLSQGLVDDLQGGSAAPHMVQNPDGTWGFSPERQALHQQILDRLLAGFKSQDQPRYHVMGGGPAAGKSTMEAANPEISEGHALLNADEIKEMLPEYAAKTNAGDPDAASHVHEESSYLVKQVMQEAFDRKVNVTLDGTGDSSAENLRKKLAAARAAGYSVHGYYVTAETDEAVRRAQKRAERTGRYVPESVIRGTHKSVSSIFEDIQKDFDSLVLYDTQSTSVDGGPATVLLKEPGGNTKIMDADLYAKFLAKANE